MKPRVFVSSTIRDLHHIRDAVRDVINEIGHEPVMSEHGEVGYLPTLSAADACYQEATDCDLGILIIGKRYGECHRENVSVTHAEFRTLHQRKVPLVTLVENDVFSAKSIYEASAETDGITIPGMDRPASTFEFISEVMQSPYNNGVSEFRGVSDVRDYIKAQFSHIFGDLLRSRAESQRSELRDILSAVTALRHDINQGASGASSNRFLRASRAFLSDDKEHFKRFLENLCGSIDSSIQAILDNETFDELLLSHEIELTEIPNDVDFQNWMRNEDTTWASIWGVPGMSVDHTFGAGGYAKFREGGVAMSAAVARLFRANYIGVRSAAID